MKRILFLLTLLAPLLLLGEAGKILALKGKAEILRANEHLKANIGMELLERDTITTTNGKMQVAFRDGTIITVGKDSNFKIAEYRFEDATSANNKLDVSFGDGVFKSITGAIGKANHDKFSLKTKTSTIGIRGTTVFVESAPAQPDNIACLSGAISVTSVDTNITIDVDAGEITQVATNQPPTPPRAYTSEEVKVEDVEEEQETQTTEENSETKTEDSKKETQSKEKKQESSESKSSEEKQQEQTTQSTDSNDSGGDNQEDSTQSDSETQEQQSDDIQSEQTQDETQEQTTIQEESSTKSTQTTQTTEATVSVETKNVETVEVEVEVEDVEIEVDVSEVSEVVSTVTEQVQDVTKDVLENVEEAASGLDPRDDVPALPDLK